MPIAPREYPVRFTPRGLCDAFDSTDAFAGACQSLQNLIFDQSNPEIVVSRPGVSTITSFAGFNTPGVISVHVTIGMTTYGMIATARNAGHDEPFAYDHNAGAFITISGVVAGNTPTTPSTTGAWTPPTMASIGAKIIVTHPGFNGVGANFFGVIDVTNPAAPAWSSANTTVNLLPTVPVAVANFNNRAYFAVQSGSLALLYYSDVLAATVITNATNILTIGDTSPITALCGLPIQTTSSGITQALLVFKATQIWQVTGDLVGATLSLNYISLTIGCSAPRSLANSPLGTYFISNSGPMMVSQAAGLLSVLYSAAQLIPDVQAPFQAATQPTRIAGGYCATIYRVSVQTFVNGQAVTNDYWFDEHKRRWNGPHTFNYACASQLGNFFVLVSNDSPGKLIKSEVEPSQSSVYTDIGAALTGNLLSSTLPKTQNMNQKQVVESTIELSSGGASVLYTITAQDEIGSTINSVIIPVTVSGKLWGAFFWGDGTRWTSSLNICKTYTIPWTMPLVFPKLQLNVQVTSSSAIAIGTAHFRYQDLGYTMVG